MTNRNVGTSRVSGQQLYILCEYLQAHKDIAVAYNRSLQSKEYSRRKWQEITRILNAQGDGAYKDWKAWSKYWVDYKAKLKRRVAALRLSQERTGGGPTAEQPLSSTEIKFLQILGKDYEQGLSSVQEDSFLPSGSNARTAVEVESSIINFPNSFRVSQEDSQAPESILAPSNYLNSQYPIIHEDQPPEKPPPTYKTPPIPDPPAPPAAASDSPRRRRRRREMPLSLEVARRSHVQTSERRAAVQSSQTLEAILHTLRSMSESLTTISNSIVRIERSINTRAAE